MKQWWLALALTIGSGPTVGAQVIPDNTLGAESSVVNSVVIEGLPFQGIEAGATRGGNLFHSFESFSIPSQAVVFFNNSPDIDRIISRVTGSQISRIDGLLAANGEADLFLVNPNGILFGPNAELFLGGSFVASTGEGWVFADGYQFGTADPTSPPLLTVNVPVGLQMGSNPGALEVMGSTLLAAPGQTLALVGGDVTLDAASLQVESGQLQVGSVVESGFLGLDPDSLMVNYQAVQEFGRLEIGPGSFLGVNGSPSGSIHLQAGQIVSQDALITSQTQGESKGGDIHLTASEFIAITDSQPGTGISTLVREGSPGMGGDVSLQAPLIRLEQAIVLMTTRGDGDAGQLLVIADQLQLLGGSQIRADALQGSGDAGDILIQAGNILIDSGSQPDTLSGISSVAGSASSGNSGSIRIEANTLTLDQQGQISASTNGPGAGGSIQIQADQVLIGQGGTIESGTRGTGAGGTIILRTGSLQISQLAGLSVITEADGAGGSIDVQADRVDLLSGGQIQASTFDGSGAGGQITLQVSDRLLIQGKDPDLGLPSAIVAGATGSGQGGDVDIRALQTQVRDGGVISVSSLSEDPRSAAGSLTLNSNSVLLDSGSLIAFTNSGDQGNIIVNSDILILRNQSIIITDTFSGTATGGNITLQAEVLAALEKSAIIARAIVGQGGNISITAPGIFGSSDSLLSASSELGLDGEVEITVPNVDPTADLVDLPDQVTPLAELAATLCQQGSPGSSFVLIGRGGIPQSSGDLVENPVLWQDLRPVETTETTIAVAPGSGWYALSCGDES
ncbi:MAG: filamentous hemagglutinin N-terminal domain-containing protein [Cyanophyceae cyanobacterium]